MAQDYTTHYHLDKYVAGDKPNLRDQYNAAMDKIDLALLSANTNATEAKNTVLNFDGDITALEERVDTIDGEVDDLGDDLSTAVATLNARIDNVTPQKRIVLIVTDSYGNTLHSPKSFLGYLSDWCKDHVIKSTFISGGGFNGGQFYTYFQTLVNTLNANEKSRVQYVFFVGGHNDADQNATQSALNTAVASCKALMDLELPNAVGVLSHVGTCVQGRSDHSADRFTKMCIDAERWKIAATANGMVSDDNAQYTLMTLEMFDSDYVHPSDEGQKSIAARLFGMLYGVNSVRGTGNQVRYHNNTDGTITYTAADSVSPVVTDSTNVLYVTINGSRADIQIGVPSSVFTIYLNSNSYITPDAQGKFYAKIGEHSIPCITGKWYSIPIAGILTLENLSTQERYYPAYAGSLVFDPTGNLYFKAQLPNKAESGFAASSCTAIRFSNTGGVNIYT